MKAILLLLLLSTVSLFADAPWPGVQFTEVRAYAWPNDKTTERVILDGMKLKSGAINEEGAPLTADQNKRLLAAVTGAHHKYRVAACHLPHNAFVFFDAAHKPVAFVEVCFSCFSMRAEPRGAVYWPDLISLASIFDDLKLPMGSYANLKAFETRFRAVQGK